MKKVISAFLLCSVILLSFCSFTPVKVTAKPTQAESFDQTEVLKARFLNMLNHNFVYNDAFYNDEELVNSSSLALLTLSEEGFVNNFYVKDYIFNMYGKIFDNFDGINEGMPQKDGSVYVIPRGYDLYEHKISSVIENEDGSYTVITDVIIDYHFGEKVEAVGTTLFLPSEDSQFGFIILYSDLAYPLEYAMAE